MASSPPDPHAHTVDTTAGSRAAFALEELAACWTQAYEAMARGDLERVGALMDTADTLVAAAGDSDGDDGTEESALRQQARAAYALLQHAMQDGMMALQRELEHTRKGKKALAGYGGRRGVQGALGSRLTRSV